MFICSRSWLKSALAFSYHLSAIGSPCSLSVRAVWYNAYCAGRSLTALLTCLIMRCALWQALAILALFAFWKGI